MIGPPTNTIWGRPVRRFTWLQQGTRPPRCWKSSSANLHQGRLAAGPAFLCPSGCATTARTTSTTTTTSARGSSAAPKRRRQQETNVLRAGIAPSSTIACGPVVKSPTCPCIPSPAADPVREINHEPWIPGFSVSRLPARRGGPRTRQQRLRLAFRNNPDSRLFSTRTSVWPRSTAARRRPGRLAFR